MNPLDLAVIGGRFQQLVDEMDLVRTKSAMSPVVSEMLDRANALIDARRTEVVAQGETGLPAFISVMQSAAETCLADVRHELCRGDVVVSNDPYLGGTHLNDIKMYAPWYWGDQLVFLLVNTGHYVDVGAVSAGAFDPGTSEIFQEGLRLPPTWLVRAGEERRDIVRLLTANSRLPLAYEGDLRAQMNALEVGGRRLDALAAQYGVDALIEASEELADRAEKHMRTYLAELGELSCSFEDVVEDEDRLLTVRVHITSEAGDVHVDFSGSSPASPGPFNLTTHTTRSATFVAFKHLFPDVPNNGGCFRPFRFTIEPRSCLGAEEPSAVGGYTEPALRVVDVVLGAIGTQSPERSYAGSFGSGGVVTLSGSGPDGRFSSLLPMCGGYGASRGHNGLVHGPAYTGTARFPSLEFMEAEVPVRWEELSLRTDSGGDGEWRGGDGTIYRLRPLAPMTLSFLGSRGRSQPFGLAGGEPGAPVAVHVSAGSRVLGGDGITALRNVELDDGDAVEWRSPGGGGWGRSARSTQG
jgi:N-methylhydantoinase B